MAGRLLAAALILSFGLHLPAWGQASGLLSGAPEWRQLNAQQRTALAPLAREWNGLSDNSRQKWLGIALRFSRLDGVEQARMQDRMREWVRLTPAQRDLARIQYQQLHAGGAQRGQLEEKWREYQALPEEVKARLRAGGRPVIKAPAPSPVATTSAPAGRPELARPPKALTLKGRAVRPAPLAVNSAPAAVTEEEEYPDDSDF